MRQALGMMNTSMVSAMVVMARERRNHLKPTTDQMLNLQNNSKISADIVGVLRFIKLLIKYTFKTTPEGHDRTYQITTNQERKYAESTHTTVKTEMCNMWP